MNFTISVLRVFGPGNWLVVKRLDLHFLQKFCTLFLAQMMKVSKLQVLLLQVKCLYKQLQHRFLIGNYGWWQMEGTIWIAYWILLERERWQSTRTGIHTLSSSSRFNFFFSAPATGPSRVIDRLTAIARHSRSSRADITSFLQICWETLNPKSCKGFVEEALKEHWSKNTSPYIVELSHQYAWVLPIPETSRRWRRSHGCNIHTYTHTYIQP